MKYNQFGALSGVVLVVVALAVIAASFASGAFLLDATLAKKIRYWIKSVALRSQPGEKERIYYRNVLPTPGNGLARQVLPITRSRSWRS